MTPKKLVKIGTPIGHLTPKFTTFWRGDFWIFSFFFWTFGYFHYFLGSTFLFENFGECHHFRGSISTRFVGGVTILGGVPILASFFGGVVICHKVKSSQVFINMYKFSVAPVRVDPNMSALHHIVKINSKMNFGTPLTSPMNAKIDLGI